MHRITTGFLLATLAAFMLGCGGSSAPAPDGGDNTGNNNGGNGLSETTKIVEPTSISGDHSVTAVPGQINVVAGGTEAQLKASVADLGFSVVHYDNGRAVVQVPVGTEDSAVSLLKKEFNIIRAERVMQINSATFHYSQQHVKATSFYPQFPQYSEVTEAFFYNGTPSMNLFFGQAMPSNMQKFNAAWETTIANPAVAAQPVSIAIIDAGWFDYSIEDQPGLNDVADDATGVPGTVLDVVNSGYVDGAGVFTPGLTAATWELSPEDPADPYPFRPVAASMLGMLAAGSDGFVATIRAQDLTGDGLTADDVWNEGTMGANPNANYILIKTGSASGNNWVFTDNEIAASIDHAVASDANIILLGMFGQGPVSPIVSTAIQDARNADVLVIAPAGDVIDTYDNDTDVFTGTASDISVTTFTPASDPNVLSVAGTGANRIQPLGDVDPGPPPIPNNMTGWFPMFGGALQAEFNSVAYYCNTGADIAGVGFGMGFGPRPYLRGAGGEVLPGFNYSTTLDRFGSNSAAAHVAGAASLVFQTLSEINGAPPTDDEVLDVLLNSVQLRGMTGIDDPNLPGIDDGGLLDAGLAVATALNGGTLVTPLPALQFTALNGNANNWLSQPNDGVTRGTDLSIAPTVANGTAPYQLTVDWGDGNGPVVIPNWTSGDPVDLVGGYENVGDFFITVTVEDANGLIDSQVLSVRVINPMSAAITIESATGAAVPAGTLKVGTTYRFNANPGPAYTGNGNVTTFSWDFNGDNVPDETGPTPTFAFPSTGSFTVTLTIEETERPFTTRTLDVIVSN